MASIGDANIGKVHFQSLNLLARLPTNVRENSMGHGGTPMGRESNFSLSMPLESVPYSTVMYDLTEPPHKIFNANWKELEWYYPPVSGKKGYIGSVSYWEYSGEVTVYDASLYPNTTVTFPLADLARSTVDDSDEQYWWFGGLGNGSQIMPGDYV